MCFFYQTLNFEGKFQGNTTFKYFAINLTTKFWEQFNYEKIQKKIIHICVCIFFFWKILSQNFNLIENNFLAKYEKFEESSFLSVTFIKFL